MSKSPKKSRHRIPPVTFASYKEPLGERYQAEVDASMDKLARQYAKAERALTQIEAKAERARQHQERLESARTRSLEVAANRQRSEQLLSENLTRIKEAAKNARVKEQREKLEAQRADAHRRKLAFEEARRQDQRESRQREIDLKRARAQTLSLADQVEERRRELRAIERLMMPESYNNRDSHRSHVRHQTGT